MIEGLVLVVFGWWLNRAAPARTAPDPELDLPAGTSRTSNGVYDYDAQSGARYRITTFPLGDESLVHIARARRNNDWISFSYEKPSNTRALWRMYARTPKGAATLRRDFGL
jgi:hypothetical protein